MEVLNTISHTRSAGEPMLVRPDLDALFIYADSAGRYRTYMTRGMERYLKE